MNLNVLKGMLIILVIADHNEFTRSLFPAFFLGMTFHVVGFMTIPFLKPAEPVGTRRFADYAFRLYWPFLVVTCALWTVVTALGTDSIAQRLALLPLALYSGNANLLKQVTHMGLLWFLPSFISIVTLRGLIASCRPVLRWMAWLGLAACHLVIGAFALMVENYLPLGLLPALYMAPLAYAGALLQRRVLERLPLAAALALTVATFAAVKTLQMAWSLPNEVGFSMVADWRDLQAMAVNDAEAISGTLMLFQLARLPLGTLLEACGKHSMQIYLFHAFVALGLFKLLTWLAPHAPVALLFAGSLAATVLLTLALASAVMRLSWPRRALFPRAPADLPRPFK